MIAKPLLNSSKENKSDTRAALKETRRWQLIEATIDSIAQHGIARTTMATITKQAGMSIGIVNFYFKSKQALFEETLRLLAEEHRDRWRQMVRDATLDPASKLTSIVEAHFHPDICNDRKLAVWFGFYGEIGSRASFRQIMTEIDKERWCESTDLCREIIAEGGYDVDPLHVAETLEGLYDGFFLNILIYPKDFSPTDACGRVRNYLASIFPQHFPKTQPCLR
jgi:TetR/AcrR family transcriptional repressor of bet genes